MIHTVILLNDDRTISAHHVEAEDGTEALRKIAKAFNGELVIAIAGAHGEPNHESDEHKVGTLTFPGDGLVECDEYLKAFEED